MLIPMFFGCGNSEPYVGNPEFDAHLQKLMDEPYDPSKPSKY